MKNYFKQIIKLFTEHEYPESTQQEFYQWLVDEEHAPEKEEALQGLWEKALRAGSAPKIRRIRPIRIWQAAAVFFLIAASSLYLSNLYKATEDNLLQQYIPTAEMQSFTLPDGTQVQLNSHSTLLYPKKFTGKNRSVFLIGEANFKVRPDKKHPFIVKSNDFQVTALGTEFNVTAYPEHATSAATLISGSVLVEYNNLKSQIILKPNEQLAYNKKTHEDQLCMPDMKEVTAWQRGELIFREMTVQDIITVLERKYPYTFEYKLKSLKTDRYSFRFKDGASLAEVMDVIVSVVGQMEYQIKENKCYLIPK